ncbi:protein S100-G-like [Protopterus annectens]|uniref:protein S100-G-like n=1 Tax=Protopterus annectens TaxID=7888 RepID=UPI001CFB2124|nr:protein S100-G-like [Protopterus annectens]
MSRTAAETHIKELGKIFDICAAKDGDSKTMNYNEFEEMINTNFPNIAKGQNLKEMMAKLDKDCSGELDKTEFGKCIGNFIAKC